jgi:hypothetical protein
VREITITGQKISADEVMLIINKHISEPYKNLLQLENLTTLPKDFYKSILKVYKNDINAKIQQHFQFLKPNEQLGRKLFDL